MKSSPTISVIMPVYNGAKFLRDAVQSILDQTYPDFEFIIIDDGSTDNTADILHSFTDKRIKVITHSKNLGIVRSLNDGISVACGEYLARMDADDLSDPHRFAVQKKFLDAHPGCAVVGSFLRIISPDGKLLFTIEPPVHDLAIKKFLLQDSCLAHGSVMMRRRAVVAVGMYSRDRAVQHAEDYDLFVRLASQYALANIPEYLYTRKEHEGSVSHRYASIQARSARSISHRAQKLIKLKHLPKFSVLMPNYNKGEYIGEAIESVLAQTMKNWELIIIDDGSTDDSDHVIQKYLGDPRLIYLKNLLHLGKAKIRNMLVKESVATIFGELDSDDTLEPDTLQVMLRAHREYPHAGLIYSQFDYCDPHLVPYGLGFCRAGGVGETNLHTHYASAFRTYKRQYFDQTSGFDTTLSGAEDLDMIYKMEEVEPIHFVNRLLYHYRVLPHTAGGDTIPGLISVAKAKCYAFIRRRHTQVPNLTLFELFRQLLNLGYTILNRYHSENRQ